MFIVSQTVSDGRSVLSKAENALLLQVRPQKKTYEFSTILLLLFLRKQKEHRDLLSDDQ